MEDNETTHLLSLLWKSAVGKYLIPNHLQLRQKELFKGPWMFLTKTAGSRPQGKLSLPRQGGTGMGGDDDHEVVSSLSKPLIATSFLSLKQNEFPTPTGMMIKQ